MTGTKHDWSAFNPISTFQTLCALASLGIGICAARELLQYYTLSLLGWLITVCALFAAESVVMWLVAWSTFRDDATRELRRDHFTFFVSDRGLLQISITYAVVASVFIAFFSVNFEETHIADFNYARLLYTSTSSLHVQRMQVIWLNLMTLVIIATTTRVAVYAEQLNRHWYHHSDSGNNSLPLEQRPINAQRFYPDRGRTNA